jgi:hydrogenase maturation factor HypE
MPCKGNIFLAVGSAHGRNPSINPRQLPSLIGEITWHGAEVDELNEADKRHTLSYLPSSPSRSRYGGASSRGRGSIFSHKLIYIVCRTDSVKVPSQRGDLGVCHIDLHQYLATI